MPAMYIVSFAAIYFAVNSTKTMKPGIIAFWVIFSLTCLVILVILIYDTKPSGRSTAQAIWRLTGIPYCLYCLTPKEYLVDSKKSYSDFYSSEPRYICFCDRSICLYQLWQLSNRILRSIVCCTRASQKSPDDGYPLPSSACSGIPSGLPSAAPESPYVAVTMECDIGDTSSSYQTGK
ncbi:hypothetical protein BJV82DRAFT_209707 [Fennellomyces sp. T-0311]|nr:hypothetical protein BJV82DRAFT_209707 [Fennellomyces sp. T-0311]